MQKLTAVITTYNEEENIERALKSVLWADEIIVVDSYSTDKTVFLAQKWAHKVLQNKYESPAKQKNWIIPQASHSWIFLLDADEWSTPELQQEIQQILTKGTEISAFWIKRQNYFFGKKIRYSGWQNDAVIRFFRRDECRYKDLLVHEEIQTNGQVGKLKNKIHHNTYTKLGNILTKVEKYSSWGAYDRVNKTKKITIFHLMVKPFFRFFRHYIIKLGILDGKEGLIISVISSYNVFLRSLKILRIKQGENIKKDF